MGGNVAVCVKIELPYSAHCLYFGCCVGVFSMDMGKRGFEMESIVCVQPGNRKGNLRVAGPMTFWVPHGLLDVFDAGVAECNGSVRAYLHSLLKKYRPLFDRRVLPSSDGDRFTREYQIRLAEKRKKVNFRPFGGDWAEITNVALAHGLSVCRFFSLLLTLEAVGCGSEEVQKAIHVGIPTSSYSKSTLIQQFCQTDGLYERRYRQSLPPSHLSDAHKTTPYRTEFG